MFDGLVAPDDVAVPTDAVVRAKAAALTRRRRRYAVVSGVAAVGLLAIAVPLVRNNGTSVNATDQAGDTVKALSTQPLASRLACPYTAAGARIEPAAESDDPVWTPSQARQAIQRVEYFKKFDPNRMRLWLGRYSGTIPSPLTFENHVTEPTTLTNQLVWLAVVEDIPLSLRGGPRREGASTSSTAQLSGRATAAFVDGWDLTQSVSGLSEGTPSGPECQGEPISDGLAPPGPVCEPSAGRHGPSGPSVDVTIIGRSGNQWTAPVDADGVTLEVQFIQPPATQVERAYFEITPRDAPSDHVVRRIDLDETLEPGTTAVSLHWDGRDNSGERVRAGDYRLFSYMTVTGWTPVACPDGTSGYERSVLTEGRGLGLLSVAPNRS